MIQPQRQGNLAFMIPSGTGITAAHQLVRGADEAMYQAKRAGRNQVATQPGTELKQSLRD